MSVFSLFPEVINSGQQVLAAIGPSAVDVVQSLPAVAASAAQTLTIDIDETQLFAGANLIIAALSGAFLFIAGLALGARILGAIVSAIQGLKF